MNLLQSASSPAIQYDLTTGFPCRQSKSYRITAWRLWGYPSKPNSITLREDVRILVRVGIYISGYHRRRCNRSQHLWDKNLSPPLPSNSFLLCITDRPGLLLTYLMEQKPEKITARFGRRLRVRFQRSRGGMLRPCLFLVVNEHVHEESSRYLC